MSDPGKLTVNSVSGGKTSAYIAAHYPADYNLFALVRLEDPECRFPDAKIRSEVEDRIQKPFIGTAEDDTIIYTMLDLEQYMGRPITWVSGITFEQVIAEKGGWLPNKLHRYCTHWLKINPMFYFWAEHIGTPVTMRIGFRAGKKEEQRARRMLDRCNTDGLLEFKASFEKHPNGRNKWEQIPWQKPCFPLIKDRVYKDTIEVYWQDRPVRFAQLNNCVHCFHRNPMLLKLQSITHPHKMRWAAKQEGGANGFWRSDVTYQKIMEYQPQLELSFEDFEGCDSGGCEV
ncbi:MAG: hypothetical protein AAF934_12025 [Bacteroidota bacterium]